MVLSLTTLLLAATVCSSATPQGAGAQAQVDVQRSILAMTKDGIRLEVSVAPAVGSSEVMTDFGRYFTPLDPVALVLQPPKRDTWRSELAADPNLSLLPAIGAANGDGRIRDLLDLTATIEGLWKQTADAKLRLQRSKELVAATQAIWRWGQRLDPVPPKLDRDERVEILWKTLWKTEGPGTLLVGGRLMKEVAQAQGGYGDRQIRLVDIRRGVSSEDPYRIHSAAQVAAFQHMMDVQLGSNILHDTINHEHPVARDGLARAIAQLYPDHARMFWADYLFGGKDHQRIIAAWHLVDHLPKQADGPLVAALASTTTTVSRKITVGGLTIRVEDRRPRIRMPLRPNSVQLTGVTTTSEGVP